MRSATSLTFKQPGKVKRELLTHLSRLQQWVEENGVDSPFDIGAIAKTFELIAEENGLAGAGEAIPQKPSPWLSIELFGAGLTVGNDALEAFVQTDRCFSRRQRVEHASRPKLLGNISTVAIDSIFDSCQSVSNATQPRKAS
jgi:hypothetical protein